MKINIHCVSALWPPLLTNSADAKRRSPYAHYSAAIAPRRFHKMRVASLLNKQRAQRAYILYHSTRCARKRLSRATRRFCSSCTKAITGALRKLMKILFNLDTRFLGKVLILMNERISDKGHPQTHTYSRRGNENNWDGGGLVNIMLITVGVNLNCFYFIVHTKYHTSIKAFIWFNYLRTVFLCK